MRTLLLALLMLLPSCAGAYLQSEFSSGLDPRSVAAELLPQHAPLLLKLNAGPDEEGSVEVNAQAARFRDVVARSFSEAGVELTRDPESAGAVLTITHGVDTRRHTEWNRYSTGGHAYTGADGKTRYSRGYHYSRPYAVYENWQLFTCSLFLGDAAVPQWTGAVEFSDKYPDSTLEASARTMVQMFLAGEAQPMDFIFFD